MGKKTLRLPLRVYINRGGGWPTCHFIFSPSQPCPEAPSAAVPRVQLCRRHSLSFPVAVTAVTATTRVVPCTTELCLSPSRPSPVAVSEPPQPEPSVASSASVQPIGALPQHLVFSCAFSYQFRAYFSSSQ